MELKKVIELVNHYAKNKSYHSIDKNDREFILQLHDQIIPMDVPLNKANSGGCDACIRKAMSRFAMHIDALVSYEESKRVKVADTPAPRKNKGGRPKRKK